MLSILRCDSCSEFVSLEPLRTQHISGMLAARHTSSKLTYMHAVHQEAAEVQTDARQHTSSCGRCVKGRQPQRQQQSPTHHNRPAPGNQQYCHVAHTPHVAGMCVCDTCRCRHTHHTSASCSWARGAFCRPSATTSLLAATKEPGHACQAATRGGGMRTLLRGLCRALEATRGLRGEPRGPAPETNKGHGGTFGGTKGFGLPLDYSQSVTSQRSCTRPLRTKRLQAASLSRACSSSSSSTRSSSVTAETAAAAWRQQHGGSSVTVRSTDRQTYTYAHTCTQRPRETHQPAQTLQLLSAAALPASPHTTLTRIRGSQHVNTWIWGLPHNQSEEFRSVVTREP